MGEPLKRDEEKNFTGGSTKHKSLKPLKQRSVKRRARSNLERSKKELTELTDTLTKTRQMKQALFVHIAQCSA